MLVAHLAGLDWLAGQREAPAPLTAMAPAMYTRMLRQQAPSPITTEPEAPPPRKVRREHTDGAVAVTALPTASQSDDGPAQPATAVAAASPPPAPAPSAVEPDPAPDTAADVDASDASTPDPLDSWPSDTRLTYRLDGLYRGGPLFGDARVQWQREDGRYQVRLDLEVRYFASVVMTSQGDVTPHGLQPRAYEELRPGLRRAVRFGEQVLALEQGRRTLRPPGLQDTVSQFVDLAHRFATGRAQLEVGRSVSFPMARPGAVDHWTYDVVASELLATPLLGEVEAFHLKPRPIANPRGTITAEMWFAPSLQHLPVRIKVLLGDGAYVDLVVETIEQR